MKKAMKVLLPILLLIAIIGCTVWYLFVYDRDFTRDVLLSQARAAERRGNHSLAAWFYDKAYAQADQDEDVAIELADQYKSAGNYTKAEYTLTNAIADGGSARLYIALCRTYVEQDKLLDAVTMLNNIADPAVKAELDARRPAAPTVDQAPGFYTQNISVAVTSDSGTLYVTSDGSYPSTAGAPYSEPITLPDGETTIYALSVSAEGLVSPMSIFGYTVGGVVREVSFADGAIEAAVRTALGVDANHTLFTNDLWGITEFVMPEDAAVYEDLSLMPYLKTLTIRGGVTDELHCICSLTALEELNLENCRPDASLLAAIAALPELQRLALRNCGLSNISALSSAQSLVRLDLSENSIRDLSALSSMQQLSQLKLSHNALTDLNALSALVNLTSLDVSYNSLTSITPICGLRSLTRLDFGNNSVAALGTIDNLTSLTYLCAEHNALTDVIQLAACTELTELDISDNSIVDIAPLASLKKLARFDFSYNQATALPALPKDCALVTVDGSYNAVESLEPLGGLANLNKVVMDYNEAISSVACLADCPNLYEVSVFGTRVSDASELNWNNQGVIVRFDPTQSGD